MLTNRSAPPATVTPVLVYPDVRAAVAWLESALGFEERVRIGDAHRAQMRVGSDGAIVVADVHGQQVAPSDDLVTHVVKVRVPDVDAACARAREAGGEFWRSRLHTRPASARASSRIWQAIAGISPRPCVTSSPRSGAALRSHPGKGGTARGASFG
jgi:hypothetical protein